MLLAAVASVAWAVGGTAGEHAAAAPYADRAWELITPPSPNERTVVNVFGTTPAGDRVAYVTNGAMPGAEAGSARSPNFAVRGPSGWRSVPLDFPYSISTGLLSFVLPVAVDEDFSHWVWRSATQLLPEAPSPLGLYTSGIDGPPTLIASESSFELDPIGASADARTFAFNAATALLPADVRTSGRQAYEYGPGGLRLVGVDDAGVPLSPCGAKVGAGGGTFQLQYYQPNPVSRDGRRIFVSSPDSTDCNVPKRVYLRENGSTTTEISASRCARPDCNSPSSVSFMGATPSGSVAYLATDQQLTDDDVDDSQDLYRYDVPGGTLARVSAAPFGSGAAVAPTNVLPSEDGSRVYFVAGGVLEPGAPGDGSKIYVADDDGLRLVAPLAGGDPWTTEQAFHDGAERVQATPDGSRLLFTSTGQLTSDDTDASRDVYLYDAEQDELTRVSGLGAGGNGAFDADYTQSLFGVKEALRRPTRRSITDDGRRVFFLTREALVAADANATADVYEWADGDLRLVTSGAVGAANVEYRTASPDGRSVFFVTSESLVAADDDLGDSDLYVAHEGGGFPEPDPPPAPCSAGSCAEPPIERVERPVPATVRFGQRRAARRLTVLPVSVGARRRAAAGGVLTLNVRIPAAGRVTARASMPAAGRRRTVARAHADATRAGRVRLRLRLAAAARRRLSEGGALPLRVVVRQRRSGRAVVRLTLKVPR